MSKILVDTNILVYGIDQDSKYFKRARQVLDFHDHQLITTSKNLVEFLAVVTKPAGYGLETNLALEIIDEIIQGMEVLYPNQESMAVFLEFLARYQVNGLKVHDLEIVSIGIANGVHDLATLNTKDFDSIKEISLIEV